MAENTTAHRGIGTRVTAGVAATAVALGVALATASAAHADDWTPPLHEPGQAGPSTSIEPPGSSRPGAPDMDAIHQDVMP